jgi:hypothetical protein
MKAAERAVKSALVDGDEPAYAALYDEYERGFQEVPVLEDVVRIPPRRALPPNFVRGERRDLRKRERADGYAQREASIAELEMLYGEYLAPGAREAKRKSPRAKKKSGGNKRKRKSKAA